MCGSGLAGMRSGGSGRVEQVRVEEIGVLGEIVQNRREVVSQLAGEFALL